MKRLISAMLCVCMLLSMVALPAGAVEVTDEEGVNEALSELTGETLVTFDDFFAGASKNSNSDITMEQVTGAEGDISTYLRYDILSVGSGSTSRQATYTDDTGLAGKIATGDSVLLHLVMRSAGDSEGKATVTMFAAGASSSAKSTVTIPTQWTDFYIPLTAVDAATRFTLRMNTLEQTIDIADFEVINYGGDVALDALPSGSFTYTPAQQESTPGGVVVELEGEMYSSATKASAGAVLDFTPETELASGDMALFSFDVRAQDVCGKITVNVVFSGTTTTMTYPVPVQWSRIYMPISADGTLTSVSVTVDSGTVLVGDAQCENRGTATFEDLSLESGMWLLEDFSDVALDPEDSGVGAANGYSSMKTTDLVISPNNQYVYSIGNGTFTVTDVSDATNPKVVKQLSGFGDTRQISLCADGNAVIFTCRSYGCYIVDVSDPENAYVRSHYDALEMATGLAVYKNYAFICNRFYGVEVVDLTDLDDPQHLCIIRNGGEVQSVEVVDGYLYGGLYNTNQVEIYDVRDPLNYELVGTADLSGRGDGVAVAKVGDKVYLYAGTGHHSVAGLATSTPLSNLNYGQGNGLDIFDVTDPSDPQWLSTSRIDGRFYHTSADYWGAQISYDAENDKYYAYLVSTYNGVYVYDVTDPAAPIRVSHVAVRIGTDSSFYSAPSSTRAIIFQYDYTEYVQSAAGAVVCGDGALYYAGIHTDLHVLQADYAVAHVEKEQNAEITLSGEYYNFDDFSEGTCVATQGQIYAVSLYNSKAYVAAGDEGIVIYSADLSQRLATIPTEGTCYDIYAQDGLLYSSEGTNGLVVYTIGDDGVTLTQTVHYTSGCITMARPSATGKFVALHQGALYGEIVNISDPENPVRKINIKAASQMYHHNVSTELVAGRYVCFWANSGSERWYDLGTDDSFSTPVLLSNVPTAGFSTRAAMTGGYTAYGDDQVLVTGSNGYVVYDPSTITADELKSLTTIKPVQGYDSSTKVSITGKPTIYGNLLVTCDRLYGKIYIMDITDISNPVLLKSFTGVLGNPDYATVTAEGIYLPLGYQGLVMLDTMDYLPLDYDHEDHCVCGGNSTGTAVHTCQEGTWLPWTSATSLPTSGNYYLTVDVTVSASTTVTGSLNLCLNGHDITAGSTQVFYVNAGTLTITDCAESWGTVYGGQEGDTEINGGVADVTGSGTLNIYGGIFANGKATRGGIVRIFKGTFNFYNGTIRNGQVDSLGGNIYVNANATMNMYGGTVQSGTNSGNGGNVFINLNGVLNLYGGTISGGTAGSSSGGGNIYVNTSSNGSGQLNIDGGTVTGGTAYRGGNIWGGTAATISITGGTVSNGTATNAGQNIYISGGTAALGQVEISTESSVQDSIWLAGGTLTMTGTVMTGGGIYANAGTLELAGKLTVPSLYVNGATVTLSSDMTATNPITVTAAGDTIATGTQEQTAYFTSYTHTVEYNDTDGTIILVAKPIDHTHCICGGNDTNTVDHTCTDESWSAWGDSSSLPASGSYYLTVDVTVSASTTVTGSLNLCLNGHTITAGSTQVFYVNAGTLTITDCAESWGTVYGGQEGDTEINGGVADVTGSGTLNIYGGIFAKGIATRGGIIRIVKGTFNFYNGMIRDGKADNLGGNIYINVSSTMNMYGGTVQGGSNTGHAGNIFINSEGVLNLYGGTVSGGSTIGSSKCGGNIYVNTHATNGSGKLNMSGGTVTGGTAYRGGNIWGGSAATISITGGTVSSGTATNAGQNIYISGGTADLGQVEISLESSAQDSIWLAGGTLTMTGTVMTGGGIYANAGTLNLAGKLTVPSLYVNGATVALSSDMTATNPITVTAAGDTIATGAQEQTAYFTHATRLVDYDETAGTIVLRDVQVQIWYDGELVEGYATLAQALAAAQPGQLVRLTADLTYETPAALTQDTYLDLAGYDLSGLDLGTYKLYAMDSTTNAYDCTNMGQLTNVTGTPETHWKDEQGTVTGAIRRYMAIEDENGWSFHRFYLGITHISLVPDNDGVGYKATFAGDEMVISQVESYGYNLWLEGGTTKTFSQEGSQMVSGEALTLRINNFLVEDYSEHSVYGQVYMTLTDGTVIESSTVEYTLRSMVESVYAAYDTLTDTQKTAIDSFIERYEEITADWNI